MLTHEEINERILKERARKISVKIESENNAGALTPMVCVKLGEEIYCIASSFVMESLSNRAITWLPGVPDFVAGIINHRGQVVSILYLKRLLGFHQEGLDSSAKIIILKNPAGRMEFGLLVDQLLGFKNLNLDQLVPLTHAMNGPGSHYIAGIGPNKEIVIHAKYLLEDPGLIVNHAKK